MALRIVATCALGLEEFLEQELRDLAMKGVAVGRGAVRFEGRWRDIWRANWWLRTANRVLVELGRWQGHDGDALATGARRLIGHRGGHWDGLKVEELFDPGRTLALHATSTASAVRDTRWVGLRVKDGLVDGQRGRFRRRSSIDRRRPDVPLRVWLHRDRATLLLDTSGEPLDRRGYRQSSGTAPLRETLAAACVLASAWDGRGPVVDPMCGTGTLLVEAALWASGRAPGETRRGFAFERLPNLDRRALTAIKGERSQGACSELEIVGVDHDPEAVSAARENLTRAGLDAVSRLQVGDGFALDPPARPGLVLINPPYGERLDAGPEQWRRLGDLLKGRYSGWQAVVLAGGDSRGKHIGLKPRRRVAVRNGPLDARILPFDLYPGSRTETKR
ncbi:MAG: RNA methyltransferase [Acidobacteriota bacterium]